jgi:hypothetical protein
LSAIAFKIDHKTHGNNKLLAQWPNPFGLVRTLDTKAGTGRNPLKAPCCEMSSRRMAARRGGDFVPRFALSPTPKMSAFRVL